MENKSTKIMKCLNEIHCGITNLLVLQTIDSELFEKIVYKKLQELSTHINYFKDKEGLR